MSWMGDADNARRTPRKIGLILIFFWRMRGTSVTHSSVWPLQCTYMEAKYKTHQKDEFLRMKRSKYAAGVFGPSESNTTTRIVVWSPRMVWTTTIMVSKDLSQTYILKKKGNETLMLFLKE